MAKIEYHPSESFFAEQGLPDTTEINLDDSTEYMYEFIALFVSDPINKIGRVNALKAKIKGVVDWNLKLTN